LQKLVQPHWENIKPREGRKQYYCCCYCNEKKKKKKKKKHGVKTSRNWKSAVV
jgi:hypothetical protein